MAAIKYGAAGANGNAATEQLVAASAAAGLPGSSLEIAASKQPSGAHEAPSPAPSDVREHFFHEWHAHQVPPQERDLPLDYGDTLVRLLVRDPEWIYAYWELNDATRAEFQVPRSGHNRRMSLRFYKITDRDWPNEGAHYFFDVDISPYAANWYIKVPEPNQRWCAELGVFDEAGNYMAITRSNVILTPRDNISEDVDSQWMTVEETYQRLYGLAAGYLRTGRLSGLAGGSEHLLRQIQRQVGPTLLGDVSAMSSGLFSGSSESVTGGARSKDFWLNVHTELILYGATESDAKVTVQGRQVQLRPDGTFTMRFALPDGEQELRVHATNADGDMEREITPVVTRRTESQE